MSSILTNNGAMVALQTLNSINSNLTDTQNAISTGKEIATAKDNSAIWAISKVMESDVSGLEAVSDSLALGESTVAVASAGAEQIVNLLNEMKEKVVAATGENVDQNKLTADVNALKEQIGSVIRGSQFNGKNLLDAEGSAGMTVLSSIDRAADNSVGTGTIAVASANLETNLLGGGMAVAAGATIPAANILADVNVSSAADATTSVAALELHIQTAVDAAAALGSSAKRINDQGSFVSKVKDAMVSGIGSMVDTDMEAASAKLQALQTQQQLGVQALSIANQAPQTILSLFR